MAKNKTRKNSKKKQKENEILLYVYALFMITLSLIGGLQIGFVGQTKVLKTAIPFCVLSSGTEAANSHAVNSTPRATV